MGVLILSNAEPGDVLFDGDCGSWNVTRAIRDCAAGRHKHYLHSVAEVYEMNKGVEVDPEKVASMVADPERLLRSPPGIMAMENERAWFIDGHHRLTALYRLGARVFSSFVIEEPHADPYKVYYNGERVAPWLRGKG